MKLASSLFLFLFVALHSATGLADFGPGEGGGGNEIEGAFRWRANAMIADLEKLPSSSSLCSAKTLRKSLDATKIRVVENLQVPAGYDNGVLDAFTAPGDMQLLRNSWHDFLNPNHTHVGMPVDMLIMHEVFRATGAACPDDKFARTEKLFAIYKPRVASDDVSSVKKPKVKKADGPMKCEFLLCSEDNGTFRTAANAYIRREYCHPRDCDEGEDCCNDNSNFEDDYLNLVTTSKEINDATEYYSHNRSALPELIRTINNFCDSLPECPPLHMAPSGEGFSLH
jgi:hypothetical protein